MIHVETTKANAELVAIQAPIRRSSLPFLRKTLLVIATDPEGTWHPAPVGLRRPGRRHPGNSCKLAPIKV